MNPLKTRVQPHLRVGEGDVADVVIITGNPDRVPKIASKMKDPEERARYRGLVTYYAYTPKGNPVTISGTGMGVASTHICIEELANLGAKVILRLGSCGGIDPSVITGNVVVPTGCVRDERASLNYAPIEYPAVASPRWFQSLYNEISKLLPPERVHSGICWTTDIYYANPEYDQLNLWTRAKVKCVEMESSLVFTFAQTRGLDAASILSCDGNLHGAQKGEQKDETEETGEQDPLIIEAIEKTVLATISAIDHITET
ncbi:nucleoside phosphorylase [Candidatus Thorarchaeota archaeon]|nr:MAG: nucleoside phosphorylase [Candidatus Thorarchaeota archaeon]